jgi:hypothetical protein
VKEHHSGNWYEIRPNEGVEVNINGESLTIQGATLCRADPTGRP